MVQGRFTIPRPIDIHFQMAAPVENGTDDLEDAPVFLQILVHLNLDPIDLQVLYEPTHSLDPSRVSERQDGSIENAPARESLRHVLHDGSPFALPHQVEQGQFKAAERCIVLSFVGQTVDKLPDLPNPLKGPGERASSQEKVYALRDTLQGLPCHVGSRSAFAIPYERSSFGNDFHNDILG